MGQKLNKKNMFVVNKIDVAAAWAVSKRNVVIVGNKLLINNPINCIHIYIT